MLSSGGAIRATRGITAAEKRKSCHASWQKRSSMPAKWIMDGQSLPDSVGRVMAGNPRCLPSSKHGGFKAYC